MNEEMKNIQQENLQSPNEKSDEPKQKSKSRKKNSSLMRVLTMVLLLCVASFGAIIISDLVSSKNSADQTHTAGDQITIKITSDGIYLDGNNKVTLSELRDYLTEKESEGKLPVICPIIDTNSPADYILYNQVADVLGEFGVHIERMQPPATSDEMGLSTKDEETY